MFKRLLVTVVLTLLATACATPQPETLAEFVEHHAFELHKQCLSYYFLREPMIVYPDPVQICYQVYALAARGERVPNWKM